MASVLEAQSLNSFQSDVMPKPNTITTAATIVPINRFSFITGSTAIATIVPPIAGAHELVFVFLTNQTGQFLTTGNIQQSTTTVTANIPVHLVYMPTTNKYYYRAS